MCSEPFQRAAAIVGVTPKVEFQRAYNEPVRPRRAPPWASRIRESRESPRYSVPEAAGYLQIPHATLASWVFGRDYPVAGGTAEFTPLIKRPDPNDARISFANLIEAHTLRALRAKHNVPMKAIRVALGYAEKRCNVSRLLLSDELRTSPGEVFLQRLDDIINIGRGGQQVLKGILETFLERVDRDVQGSPLRLFPFTRPTDQIASHAVPKLVLIDPDIASGRPILARKAIRTSTIAGRFHVGETMAEIADDYGLTISDIEEAIRYEPRPEEAAA